MPPPEEAGKDKEDGVPPSRWAGADGSCRGRRCCTTGQAGSERKAPAPGRRPYSLASAPTRSFSSETKAGPSSSAAAGALPTVVAPAAVAGGPRPPSTGTIHRGEEEVGSGTTTIAGREEGDATHDAGPCPPTAVPNEGSKKPFPTLTPDRV